MIPLLSARISYLIALLLLGSGALNAQLVLNEILVNPPGNDNPFEFVELRGTPGTTLNNIFLCVFEGDSASAGNCDLSIPLNGVTIGSNGLIFVGTSIGYTNIPSETYFKDTLLFGIPEGYLENGNTTFALVFSTVNMIENADYDLDNNGVLDLPQGAVLLDAVGWTNGDLYAVIYGGVVLTQSAGTPDAAVRFYDNLTPFSKPAWYNGDITDLDSFDPQEVSDNFPSDEETGLTPGNHNIPNDGVGLETITERTIELYPNPARDVLIANGFDNEAVTVLDLSGRIIACLSSNNNTLIVNTSGYDPGLYILISASGSNSSKFLVAH
jgi:hypothetical protein